MGGAGALPGKDGWVSLYLADAAPLLLPPPHPLELSALHQSVLDTLSGGYGLFFRQIADQVRATTHPEATDPQLADAIWDLAWSGRLTNDTLAPMRSLLGSGRTAGSTAHRAKRSVPRGRYGSLTASARPQSRTGPPTVAGRWSLLPSPEADPTVRAHALARTLLDRHGVVTRGAVGAEGVEGGFSAVYRVLSAFEDSGQARRGYVVEGLGAAQFAMDGAVDRLRAVANARERGGTPPVPTGAATGSVAGEGFLDAFDTPYDGEGDAGGPVDTDDPWSAPGYGGPRSGTGGGGPARQPGPPGSPPGHGRGRSAGGRSRAVVLAAADPANAFGAALSWPEPPEGAGHKPGRKAGSLVVLVDGELTLYMERGGKTLLAWPAAPDTAPRDDPRLPAAAEALSAAARAGSLGTLTVERINGVAALTSDWGTLLETSGFVATPRGLRIRA